MSSGCTASLPVLEFNKPAKAIDAEEPRALFVAHAADVLMTNLPRFNHFGIRNDPAACNLIAPWLKARPPAADGK
jgi:hypothetical protein